ncbi:MAG: IS256 family transposase [Coriobacteriia bacterium]
MTKNTMDRLDWLRKTLEDADLDLMREMLRLFAEELMSAEADARCGAAYGERSDERVNRRNGYRERELDTRVGTIPLAVPKLREGSYYPGWLLENRRRAERALVAVIAECYVRGISTRRVDGLVKALGIEGISSSQVSRMAASLDEQAEAFRSRPLDAGCYPYVWIDALAIRVREGGRVVKVACAVATAVNGEGYREIIGVDTFTEESEASWRAFLQGLGARGLTGVRLVISDAHKGLVSAIGSTMPGAAWQRCRTHFMRNALCRVPKSAQPFVATLIRTIFAQPDAKEVAAQLARVVEQLEDRFPDVAAMLEEAGPDITAFSTFPTAHWRQIWSNNPQERLNREIRRRSDVVGIFPNRGSVIRLVGAVLAEQHDEWQVARRYMSAETIAAALRPALEVLESKEEVTPALMAG